MRSRKPGLCYGAGSEAERLTVPSVLGQFYYNREAWFRECNFNCELLHRLCKKLGILLTEEKSEGPATANTSLGLEIDSLATEVRLPKEKLHHAQEVLVQLASQDEMSLFLHAATVVRPICWPQLKANWHLIYLIAAAHADLAW